LLQISLLLLAFLLLLASLLLLVLCSFLAHPAAAAWILDILLILAPLLASDVHTAHLVY
jgi:hypothetical protein